MSRFSSATTYRPLRRKIDRAARANPKAQGTQGLTISIGEGNNARLRGHHEEKKWSDRSKKAKDRGQPHIEHSKIRIKKDMGN